MKQSFLCCLLGLALVASAGAQEEFGVVPGFPNAPQTPGAILSGLNAPEQGRTAIIAYHNGVLFTVPEVPSSQPGADFQVRTWDISDPTNPSITQVLGTTPMPVNAHGYLKSGDYLVLGSNWPPEAPWSFQATTPGNNTRTEFPDLDCIGVRGCLFQPWFAGDTYWSYDAVEGDAWVSLNGNVFSTWDHLGLTGVIGHPFIVGDLLIFASDQSRTGVATYDISDPANPTLLDVLTTGGAGGYWPELWGGDGHLYVVFPYRTAGNGMRVVDVTDPSDLHFVADTPLAGAESMYIQFQDEYAFMGDHKVDMRTFQSVLFLDGANTTRPSDGGTGIDTSQFALPLGNLLVTGGIGPNEGMAIWAHQAAPDNRGPYVGYHIPQAGRANYPTGAPITLLIHETLETPTIVNGVTFIVRPLGGSPINGRLTFAFDDILTFTPDAPLQADTTYEVVLPAGGIMDAAGNGMQAYSYTFSTGSSVGGNAPPSITSFTASEYPAAPGQSITLAAAATDPNGDPVEFRFDFGDGSPKTAWSGTASVATNYGTEGHYRVSVQARDDSGSISTDTLVVTVVTPPAGPSPSRSSSLLCHEPNRRVWAVNPDNDTVTALDADSLAVLFEVPVCDDPRSLGRSATGEIWVSCHDSDQLQVLAEGNGALVDTIDLAYGSAPSGLAVNPAGDEVFVALQGSGELLRFDATTRAETGNTPLGPGPRALAISADGSRVLVTRFLSPRNHAEVWDVNAATMGLNGTLTIPKFGDAENRDGTSSGRGVANYLVGITLAPDGQSAWITANKPNTERGLFFGPDLDQDNTVRNVVVQVDLGTGAVIRSIDLDNSDFAYAAAFSPLGDYLFVALQGNGEVMVLDTFLIETAGGLGSLVTRLGSDLAPQGLCVDGATGRVFAENFMDRSVTALEAQGLLESGTINLPSTTISTVATESLSPEVLLGKQIFYNAGDLRMSSEGYLSCASCHLDGGSDGRVWDFNGRGEGFRNTISMRGRSGMGHGNVHWTANFDEIQDFENDIRGGFGGSGFMSDADFAATSDTLGNPKAGLSADLDALAAYVASLGDATLMRSSHRQADGSLTPEAVAGEAVFASLGCSSCHGGSHFTDSELGPSPILHDVGTIRTSSGQRLNGPLTGFDTPTLLGVWNNAPYLHDGSAPMLEDVFRVAGGEVVPMETGSVSGGASIVDQYVDLNNDDTVHGRAFAQLPNGGARVTLTGVDGGSGGTGALELRFSVSIPRNLEVRVNGVIHNVALEDTGNDPDWRHTNWHQKRLEGVTLSAGPTNTLEFTSDGWAVSLDDVVVTTADHLLQAVPHREVLSLSTPDQANLMAYLRQLDGQSVVVPGIVFADGFESGDTSAWSSVNP